MLLVFFFSIVLIVLYFLNFIASQFVALYCVMSVFTFIVYGIDKYKAKHDKVRVPESTLHIYSVLGGWPGAMIGQHVFRHKTVKQPFKKYLYISIVVNLICLISYLIYPHILKN